MSRFNNIVHVERTNTLNRARRWMWWIGVLTLFLNLFHFFNAGNALRAAVSAELSKRGVTTIEKVEALEPRYRAKYDEINARSLARIRLAYGSGVAMGAVFLLCAAFMPRRPLACTITALTLYVASSAAMAVFAPVTVMIALIFKIIIIGMLIAALKAALVAEREAKDARIAAAAAPDSVPELPAL